MAKARKFYLSAMGIINALGNNAESVLSNLLNANQQGIINRSDLLIDGDVNVGVVKADLPTIENMPIIFNSRNNQLLLASYYQIADQVEALIDQYGKDRIAVVLGSSTSGIAESEYAIQHKKRHGKLPETYHYGQQEMGSSALFLASLLGLRNAAITVSTACSSSGKAFITARNLIEAGFCDAALVGGVDTLCRLTLNGFNALESVSSSICNPFSQNRNGITIGEGAALFILSSDTAAIELQGLGESSDAYHMSAPDPSGAGAEMAIQQALDDANIKPQQLNYINLHGTATIKNDEMEAAVIERLFGSCKPCSSTKALTGHTLGAAAAIELGLCYLVLSDLNTTRQLPPHVWDGVKDKRMPAIGLVSGNNTSYLNGDIHMMSNSFAFGGSNVSLVIGRTI